METRDSALRRTEWKVFGTVLLTLLCVEVGLRVLESRLSLDVRYVREIPERAADLAQADGCRVLFIGNSLTNRGVDEAVVQAELAERAGVPVQVDKVHQSGSRLVEWYRIYERFYAGAERAPDLMVVGFAMSQLEDSPTRTGELARLGHLYTTAYETPDVFRHDATSFGQRTEFLLSKLSVSFALREKVSQAFLEITVPNYKQSALWVNREQRLSRARDTAGRHATYDRLGRMVALAERSGTEVVAVTMPTLEPDGRASLGDLIQQQGATHIDARVIPGLTDADFADGVHLGPTGATRYSQYIARELARRLPEACGASSSASV